MGYNHHENKKLSLGLEGKILKTLQNLELPRYEQAEKALIGLMLYREEVQKYCFDRLKHYFFYNLDCQTIYRTMVTLNRKLLSVNIATVYENNKDILPSKLIEYTNLAETLPRDVTVSNLVDTIISTRLQREVIRLCNTGMFLAGKDLSVVDAPKLLKSLERNFERIKGAYEASIDSDLSELKYDQLHEIKQFNPILSIVNPDSGKEYPICESGGMIGVIGAKGSRKTYTFKDIAVTFLGGQSLIGFQSHYIDTPNVLWIDTEQRERTFNLMCNEVSQRLYGAFGENEGYEIVKNHFHAYRVASKKRHERLRVLKNLIRKYKPDIVFVDGVVDLVGNYNDQEECRAFVDDLMEYRDDFKFTLIYVLHTAKTTGQSRGHLGTELDNKVEVVMKTSIPEDTPETTKLECIKNRETIRFSPIEFKQVKGVDSYLKVGQKQNNYDDSIPF